jgi:hypothetical protein
MICEPEVDRRPYRPRDFEYVHAGRDGTYWQAADGMIVRVAAAEPGRRARATDASFAWYLPLVALVNQAWQR